MLFSVSIGNGFAAIQMIPPAPMSFPLPLSREKDLIVFLSGDAAPFIRVSRLVQEDRNAQTRCHRNTAWVF